MRRTIRSDKNGKKAYRLKPHVGSHWYPEPGKGLKKYGPGQIIHMFPDQAKKISHKLENYQEEEFQDAEPTISLRIVERGDGLYDVINEKTRHPVNDAPLSLKQSRVLAGEDAKVEKIEMPEEETPKPVPSKNLTKKHRGGGRYLVIDQSSGEAISDNYFNRQEADDLVRGKITLEELREAAETG
jgi:hypothetical protein